MCRVGGARSPPSAAKLLDNVGAFRFQRMAEGIVGRDEIPILLALLDERAGGSGGQGMIVPGPMEAVRAADLAPPNRTRW